MSVLGTSTLALALVYAAIALHTLLLWGGRREDRVVWAFGMVCMSMAAYAFACTGLSEAQTVASAGAAQSAQLVSASLAVAFHLVFCQELRGHVDWRISVFGWALPLTAMTLAARGLLVEAQLVDTSPLPLLGRGPTLVQTQIALGGYVVQTWLLFAVGLAIYLAYSGEDRQRLRPPFVAPLLVLMAVIYDLLAECFHVDTVYASEYAFLALALGGSQRLIARGRRATDALEQRTLALEASARRIEATKQATVRRERLAAVGELSAIVAHELRNPLAIINNATQSLRRARVDERSWQQLLGVVDEEADRLDRLVRGLLIYTRPLELRPRSAPVGDLLERTVERYRRSDPPGAGVRLEVGPVSPGLYCQADTELLCQALHNLVDNATHALSAGGRIVIEAWEDRLNDQPAALLKVRDDGPGMPQETLGRARELFFTTRREGTGLGLAIVERVVLAHRGTLDIESSPGCGTVVSLRIPQRPEAVRETTRGATNLREVNAP